MQCTVHSPVWLAVCVRHAAPSQYGKCFYKNFQHYIIIYSPGIKHVWGMNEVICNIDPKMLWVINDEMWRHCLPYNGVLFTCVLAVYIFVNNQLDAQFSCMFISILYMFRAAMCPSSGELLYQCDTWFMSLCVDDRLVCRSICSYIPDGHLHRVT